MSRHYVITISRQFGTGGREIGKALGAALGVPVYDRELLEEAARTYCIPVSVMERNDETAPSRVLESFALSAPSLSMLTGAVDYSTIVTSDTTFAWQSATIRRLAKEGPCVIIGRCADHVLRGTPGVVSLFLYADYEARVDHITQKYQLSRGDATILIDETEKERARYYKRHTGQEFARMENYDLCLNTASVNREMAILLLKWKDLMVTFFDESHARSIGLNTTGLKLLFFTLLAACTVAALQTVGAFLVICLVVTPGATAWLLTDRFPRLLAIAVAIGSLTSFFGAWLSYYLDGATGGIIVVAQTLLFLLTFVFAPKHGLLANRRRAREGSCC